MALQCPQAPEEQARQRQEADKVTFALQTVLLPGEVLPAAFEASEKWPNLIHEPLDQGNCAGSWAFSTAGKSKGGGWHGGQGGLRPEPSDGLSASSHQPWHPIVSQSILWGT